MGKVSQTEQIFNKNLDAWIAHKEAGFDGIADSDLRSALDFARKMDALCAKPSPEYKARLKASLLQRIAREEATKANRRSWWSGLAQQPMMRLATAVVLVALVSTGLWAGGVFNRHTAITTPESPLVVSASTNKTSYSAGEAVLINVSLTNETAQNLEIEQYPPILSLMDVSSKQAVYTFKAGTTSSVLAPGETAAFTLTWNQRNDRGTVVSGGSYYIELEDLYYQGHSVKLTLSHPVSFDILPVA